MKKRLTLLIVLILFLVYFSQTAFFTFYALPNTYVNGYNMSYVEKSKIVDRNASDNTLTIYKKDDPILKINTKQVDFNLKIPEDFKFEQNPLSWPLSFFDSKKYTIHFDYSIDEAKLNQLLNRANLNKNAKKSYNAYIAYLDDNYTIIPEEEGNEIDIDKLKQTIKKALLQQKKEITIKEEYKKPEIYSNTVELIRAKNKLNQLKDIEISFDFNDTIYKLKDRQVRNMIDYDEKKGFKYNTKEIENYVDELKKMTDTYNKDHTITTIENKKITLPSIDYGWQIDKDKTVKLIEETLEEGKDQTIEPVYAKTAKSRLKNDIQDEYIEIDKQNKMLYYINNYKLTKSVPIQLTNNIPKGIYKIDTKTKQHPNNYELEFYRFKISDDTHSDIIVNPSLLETIYFDAKTDIAVIVY